MTTARTDSHVHQLGLTSAQVERIRELVAEHGPFTTAERDRLAVLLRPTPDDSPRDTPSTGT